MKEEITGAEQATSSSDSLAEAPPSSASGAAMGSRIGRQRWTICALLFFASTINYVDRQVLGILAKDLQTSIGWNEIDYGNIVAAFNAAYALGLLVAGRLMDRFARHVVFERRETGNSKATAHQAIRSSFHQPQLKSKANQATP